MAQNNYNGVLQKPLGSGFDSKSTIKDVIKGIDLSDKTAIVTGGYNGLGLEVTKTLVSAGAKVIVPARDTEKAKKNLEGIDNVEIEEIDLQTPESINSFSAKFLSSGRALHLLINNAGIMWTPLQRDDRGYESHFSTNHLGHFQLTAKLFPALKKANGARIVNVSSSGHFFSPVHFEDVNYDQRPYNKFEAYGQAKTANILFTVELDKRAHQSGIRVYTLHPGLILETNLGRHLTFDDYVALGAVDANGTPNPEYKAAIKGKQKTTEQGEATTVWAATSPKLKDIGGIYCENVEVADYDADFYNSGEWQNNMLALKGIAPFALEEQTAQRLWTLSEELTNVKFDLS